MLNGAEIDQGHAARRDLAAPVDVSPGGAPNECTGEGEREDSDFHVGRPRPAAVRLRKSNLLAQDAPNFAERKCPQRVEGGS